MADPRTRKIDGVILTTLHRQFKAMPFLDFVKYFNGSGRGILVDVKSWLLKNAREKADLIYKCL